MSLLAQLFFGSSGGEGMEGEVLRDALGGHVLVLPIGVCLSGGCSHTPWRWPLWNALVKLLVPFRACEEHFIAVVICIAICYSFFLHMFSDNCQ